MSHKFKCPECRAALSINGAVPARLKCPKCGETFKPRVEDDEEGDDTPRKKAAAREEREDAPRRQRERNTRDRDDERAEEPRRKPERSTRRRDDDDEDDDKPRYGKKKQAQKKFPMWMPIAIGGAVLATVLIIVLINALKKDDKKQVASNDDNKTGTPKVIPQQPFIPAKSGFPKTGAPKKNSPPFEIPNPPIFPPEKEPEFPPMKDPVLPEPPVILLPPKKQPPKAPEDPVALIRSLDPNIQIPPLPPVEQRPVLVLDASGHTGAVKKVFFTPDGKRLVTVSIDKAIRIWDIASGATLKTIYMPNGPGDEGTLHAASLSPDGKRLAVSGFPLGGGQHGIPVYLVSLEKGTIERTLKGNRNVVRSLSFNGTGQWLASGDATGETLLFNVATGAVGGELKGHKDRINNVAYHPKDARVATCSGDGTIRIWMTGKAPYTFKELPGNTAKSYSLVWSPDGNQLAAGSADGTITVWSKDGAPIKMYEAQIEKSGNQQSHNQIVALTYTKDSKEIVYAGIAVNGLAGVLNLESGQHRVVFREHSNTLQAAAVSPDGTIAATSGGNSHETFLWWITDGSVVQKFQGTGAGLWNVAWSRDGKTIAWGTVNQGTVLPNTMPLENAFRVDSLERTPVPEQTITTQVELGGYSISRPNPGFVRVKKDGQDYFDFRNNEEFIFSATLLPNDKMIVTGAQNVMLVDLNTKQIERKYRGHQSDITCVAPCPVGGMFLTGGADSTVRIWKLDREEPVLSLFFAGREWIAWTPEGYYCCSANGERLMGWQINDGIDKVGKYYPANQFRQSLFQPEVIRNLFRVNGELRYAMALYVKEKRRPLEAMNLTQVIPPDVQITSPVALAGELKVNEAIIEVKATAKSTGKHPVTAMRLLVDGRPFGGENGVLKIPNPKLGEVQRSWKVPLPKGPHTLNVLAESAVSRGMSFPVDIEQTFGDDKLPNLFIFAAGINDYPRPMRLNYASTDAVAITKVLKEKAAGVFGKVEVKMLLDKEATKANIMQGLTWLESNMTARDIGVFFFSGHGTKDDDDNFCLVPVDVGRHPSTCVSGEAVKQKLANLPGRVVAMFDACHSGAAAESFQTGRADDLVRDLLDDDCGVVVICASLGEEYALESPLTKAGFFTLAMVEGLSGKGDLNKDGFVFINEATYYVSIRVRQLSRGMQNPTLGKSPNIKPFAMSKP